MWDLASFFKAPLLSISERYILLLEYFLQPQRSNSPGAKSIARNELRLLTWEFPRKSWRLLVMRMLARTPRATCSPVMSACAHGCKSRRKIGLTPSALCHLQIPSVGTGQFSSSCSMTPYARYHSYARAGWHSASSPPSSMFLCRPLRYIQHPDHCETWAGF